MRDDLDAPYAGAASALCPACGKPKGQGYGCAVLPQVPPVLAGAKSERVAPADGALDQIARLEAEISRLTKARAALAERLRYLAQHEHGYLATHSAYSLETCPFLGCRENAYALRLGKPRRKAVRR